MVTERVRLKMLYEKEIDDLVKDRRELFAIIGEEIPNTPLHRSCLAKVSYNTRRINLLKEKWRSVHGRRKGF